MAVKKKAAKVVKKKWFKITAPELLKEAQVGETYVSSPEVMLGKKMTVSIGSITGEPQKQHTHANLIINKVDEGILRTELLGWKILPAAVKKLIRRNRTRIDDSFVLLTKDNQYVRLKPILITRSKANGSVKIAVRKMLRLELAKNFHQKDFKILVGEILGRRLQQGILKKIAKVFPVAILDIRQLSVVEAEKVKKMNLIKFIPDNKNNNNKEKTENIDEKTNKEINKETEKPIKENKEKPSELKEKETKENKEIKAIKETKETEEIKEIKEKPVNKE